jgi:hypothetical protein
VVALALLFSAMTHAEAESGTELLIVREAVRTNVASFERIMHEKYGTYLPYSIPATNFASTFYVMGFNRNCAPKIILGYEGESEFSDQFQMYDRGEFALSRGNLIARPRIEAMFARLRCANETGFEVMVAGSEDGQCIDAWTLSNEKQDFVHMRSPECDPNEASATARGVRELAIVVTALTFLAALLMTAGRRRAS